jgi:hypothetical protein
MIFRTYVNHYCIDPLHWGSQTLVVNLVGAQMDTHAPTKETKLYIEIILVFWLVNKKNKVWYNQMCLVTSPNVNPMNEG